METNRILCLLEQRLKKSRLKHTLGVRDMAVRLAEHWGADRDKAEKAALLHDFTKNLSAAESDELIIRYNLGIKYLGNPALAHSKTAAAVLEHEYGVSDREILNAIDCHTVGKPNMTLLEKIIYVADAAEQGRDYPGVEEIRDTAFSDIDKACINILDRTIKYVLSKGEDMDNKAIAWKTAEVIDSKKGQDIVLIDISRTSGFADYFVITHAPSDRLMKTIADEVEDQLAELGVILKRSEGRNGTGWILMDFGDIIVNVFSKEQRDRYNLEKLWGDGDITYFDGNKGIE